MRQFTKRAIVIALDKDEDAINLVLGLFEYVTTSGVVSLDQMAIGFGQVQQVGRYYRSDVGYPHALIRCSKLMTSRWTIHGLVTISWKWSNALCLLAVYQRITRSCLVKRAKQLMQQRLSKLYQRLLLLLLCSRIRVDLVNYLLLTQKIEIHLHKPISQ